MIRLKMNKTNNLKKKKSEIKDKVILYLKGVINSKILKCLHEF